MLAIAPLLASITAPLIAACFDPPADPPDTALAIPQQNLVLMIADDLGVDMLSSYAEGTDLPSTPWIDLLANFGVSFRNAYANPVCSPTRAQILTGRHSFRTGIGYLAEAPWSSLTLEELLLPEALDQFASTTYASAVVGKWHLAHFGEFGPEHPLQQGFEHHEGSYLNFTHGLDYYGWTKFEDGYPTEFSTTYATVDTVDSAIDWLATAAEPWLLVVGFNAPHWPYHWPPDELHGVADPGPQATPDEVRRAQYKAMTEAMDSQIGRLLLNVPSAHLPRTTFMFTGDNGTPQSVTMPPFASDHAKLTLHEGGCNVPLIISHIEMPNQGAWSDALVQATDLFATCLELAGVEPSVVEAAVGELDSISLVDALLDPLGAKVRSFVLSEMFKTESDGSSWHSYGLRDRRFRMIDDGQTGSIAFYDLLNDPFEQLDLMAAGPLTSAQQAAYDSLSANLVDLLGSAP